MPKIGISFGNIDKVYHLFAYFTLTICWLFTYYKKPKAKYIVIVSCIIFGIIIEILQGTITSYRTGDYIDIVANTAGVIVALTIYNQILKKNKVNSQ
ncbi:VanZ family protein [Polaribacter sp. SA4-10]|uniref:VanZ family protein n=1 Tax=Polaribacter sp. SA4-10 TaxID=754397 RepID=UPI001E28E8B2|nr:VanZ family protein [Polaribacter sp. SA4-10]